jgi:hypothetical protein
MVDLVLGIAAAVGASSLYSLGIALQAVDAKQAPAHEHLRLALMRNLLRRTRWLAGTGLSVLGWPLQVVALLLAPLVVVQPTLAAGLLVLLFLAQRMLGEHAGRREHLMMCAIVLGVFGAALTAPNRATTQASDLTITIVLVALAVSSFLPYLFRLFDRPSPATVTMLGADDLSQGHLGLAIAWGVSTAVASAVAVVSEMSALQARPAIQVAPVVFVTQTVVPVVLAPLLFGERFLDTPLYGVPLAASLALLIGGAAMLARSPLLLALMEGERTSDPSGSAPSLSEPSQETIRSSFATDEEEPSSSTTRTSPARIGR